MASVPFLSFKFLQSKNLRILTAGFHAGYFAKLQELRIRAIFNLRFLQSKNLRILTAVISPCGAVLQGN
jgi:hypothetical protein